MEKPSYTNQYRNSNIENPIGPEMFPIRKQIILFVVGWFGLQIIATVIQYLLVGANVIIGNKQNYNLSILTNALGYIALCTTLLLISNKDLIRLTPSFKKYKSYIAGIVCFLSILAFSYVYSLLLYVLKINTTENANQTSLDNVSAKYFFTSLIVFGIIAPICEELTYRVGLFSLCRRRSKTFAYIVPPLVFALIHFNLDLSSTKAFLNEVLNLPHYIFAGLAFSFTYDKFGFAGSVSAHIINNVLSLTIFTLIL